MEYVIIGLITGLIVFLILRSPSSNRTVYGSASEVQSYRDKIDELEYLEKQAAYNKKMAKTHRLTNLYMGEEIPDGKVTPEMKMDSRLLMHTWVPKEETPHE